MADMNGNPIDQITGNAYGMSQQFRSTQLAVLVKFGSGLRPGPGDRDVRPRADEADAVTLAQSAQSLAQAAAAAAQAAAAAAGSGGGGVTDHGALSGLLDDDHPQYHNDARGDARYYTQAQVTAAINNAVTSSSTADRNRANHSGTQLASSISDFRLRCRPSLVRRARLTGRSSLNKPTTFAPAARTRTRAADHDSTVTGRAVLTAADAQAARAAIGAGTGNGTSNLALGSTATTAAAGNHTHTASSLAFVPSGSITAQDVQTAIQQAAATGGGTGVSATYVWRYSAGALPGAADDEACGCPRGARARPDVPDDDPERGWVWAPRRSRCRTARSTSRDRHPVDGVRYWFNDTTSGVRGTRTPEPAACPHRPGELDHLAVQRRRAVALAGGRVDLRRHPDRRAHRQRQRLLGVERTSSPS
jgi:hypothetical protein